MRITSVNTWKQVILSTILLTGAVIEPEMAAGSEGSFWLPGGDASFVSWGQSWTFHDPRTPLSGNDECCVDPGMAAECWRTDAMNDGAWCEKDSDCLSKECDTDKNLCLCENQDDCNDGDLYQGVCNLDTRLCGPSYCNGILVCDCWGGCVKEDLGPYDTPEEKCTDVSGGFPGVCCEGTYPKHPEDIVSGFCSSDPVCGRGCTRDGECNDNNPCTADTCFNGGCANLNHPNGTGCDGYYPLPTDKSLDCTSWTCNEGLCGLNITNENASCADNPQNSAPNWHSDCFFGTCGQGICTAAQEPEGTSCDDGNICSVSQCDEHSRCVGQALSTPQDECCRDDNVATYDDGNDCTNDVCDDNFRDSHQDVVQGTPCPSNQSHPDDACGTWSCGGGKNSGRCIESRFPGNKCDSTVPGGNEDTNDSCGIWTCDVNGTCTEKSEIFVGNSCSGDDADDTCGRWRCGSGADLGKCIETVQVGKECDTGAGGPGGQNTDCSYWECGADGACRINHHPAGTTTCDGDHHDDVCGNWACDGSGACVEFTHPGIRCDGEQPTPYNLGGTNSYCGEWLCTEDGSCRREGFEGESCDSASGGPGGPNDACGTWTCNGDGFCEESRKPDGMVCDKSPNGDECGDKVCQNGDCGAYSLAAGESCEPAGAENPCTLYRCSGNHVCSAYGDLFVPGMNPALQNCNGGMTGTLVPGQKTSVSKNGDSACASDDQDVLGTGRFAACRKADYADAVYTFSQRTKNDFQLRHVKVDVEVTNSGGYSNIENWDPLLYARSNCNDKYSQISCNDNCNFSGTNLPSNTCGSLGSSGAEAAITTGPWPLRDYPDTSRSRMYSTRDTYDTSLIVDSKICLTDPPCPPGGEFRLDLKLTDHKNDDCRNTASYAAAPIIAGGSQWKERWRGNTRGFGNFFNTIPTHGPSCWAGGAQTSTDPKAAFFRIELPDGVTKMPGQSDWKHSYKVYTDHRAIGGFDSVLSFWGYGRDSIGGASQCRSAVRRENLCLGGRSGYPRERVIRKGDYWRRGIVAVSNRIAGTSGNYELNVVRAPRPFVSMAKIYVGKPSNSGGCCSSNHDFANVMDMEGYRVDFVPTNDWVKGYGVKTSRPSASSLDGGWLVNPRQSTGRIEQQKICTGIQCAGNLNSSSPRSLGFSVPIGGDFYGYYCVNGAGYVSLRKRRTDRCAAYDPDPDVKKLSVPYWSGGYGPMLAPMWGNLIPCYGANRSCKYKVWWSCKLYAWNQGSCRSGRNGEIFSQLTPFEGSTARVVTWDGFQGSLQPSSDMNRSDSLQFQVIIHIDGRITFFFKSPASGNAWDKILEYAGWVIGLSGTRFRKCNHNAECTALGGSNLYCDTRSYEVKGKEVYRATKYCINRVYDYKNSGAVGGTWQGGP